MIAFIVLHYKLADVTETCVDSILKYCQNEDFTIAIVDNCSNNGSVEQLQTKYEKEDNIDIVLNLSNLGFAKGNNAGCKFAIEKYAPDFLVVLNNDTFIEDGKFINKIYENYNNTSFDILGPYIWHVKGKYNQNYNFETKYPANLKEAKKQYGFIKKLFALSKFSQIAYKVFSKFFSPKHSGKGVNGAALIFSKQYYEKFNTVIPDNFFMYSEESLLTYRAIKEGLNMVVTDKVKVSHYHGLSTNNSHKKKGQATKFYMDCIVKNYKELVEIFENKLDI